MKYLRFLKLTVLLFSILLLNACAFTGEEYLMYAGTYTGHGSEGIYAYRFNPSNGVLKPVGLVAETDNPSFLTIDPGGRFLYAVNEVDTFQNKPTGAVSVFAINRETGKLNLLQQISSLGAAPAYLSLDRPGRYLMVANYNGGNVAIFPVHSDGKYGSHTSLIQDTGSSVNPGRQAAPHAHYIQATMDNRFVLVADLGIDQVLEYRFDSTTGSLSQTNGSVRVNPGSGPRHIAFAPSGSFIYVLNELNSTITGFSFNTETGMMQMKQTILTLPGNFSGENTAAEISVDAKGKFLYVSNRGDDSIGLFSINSGDGNLTPVEWISSGGKTPRHFEIDPTGEWLFAANQDSDNIVLFRIDQTTGRLSQTSLATGVSSPVCIRFLSAK